MLTYYSSPSTTQSIERARQDIKPYLVDVGNSRSLKLRRMFLVRAVFAQKSFYSDKMEKNA